MPQLNSQNFFPSSFPLYIADAKHGAHDEHSHDFYELVYVRRGQGAHAIEGRAYPIQAGDVYVISPDERHSYAPTEGGSLVIVNVLWMPSLVEELLRADAALSDAESLAYIEPFLRGTARFARRLHLSGRMAYRVELLLDEMRHERQSSAPGSHLLLRHLFCALLVLLSRAWEAEAPRENATNPAPQQAGVARAIEYIEVNFAAPIRVSDIAAHAAMSESRLAHIFKAQTGRGLIEYLHELRIARACAALLHNNAPVHQIADTVGYTDLRFFHRLFRRHTGCNPTQYRRHFGAYHEQGQVSAGP